jgi:hypothetical protein
MNNPARWGSKGGANQVVSASHQHLAKSYQRILASRKLNLKGIGAVPLGTGGQASLSGV